jgi:hypothetical protein
MINESSVLKMLELASEDYEIRDFVGYTTFRDDGHRRAVVEINAHGAHEDDIHRFLITVEEIP